MEPVNEPVRKAPVFERKKAGRVSPKRILFHVFTATLAVTFSHSRPFYSQ